MKASLIAIALFGLAFVLLWARVYEPAADNLYYVWPAQVFFFLGILLALGGLVALLARRAWAAALVPAVTLLLGVPLLLAWAVLTGSR